MVTRQVLLVRKRVYQHRCAHLGRLHPGLRILFGLLSVGRVVRVWPRLSQLLAQLRAEVVACRRIPYDDARCGVGASCQHIGSVVDDVLGNRRGLYEVDKVDHVAAQESTARESFVVPGPPAVHGELQLRSFPQFRVRLVTMSAFSQHLRRPQGENHRHHTDTPAVVSLQRVSESTQAILLECRTGRVLILNDNRRRVSTSYDDVRLLEPLLYQQTPGFLEHIPTEILGQTADTAGDAAVELCFLVCHAIDFQQPRVVCC